MKLLFWNLGRNDNSSIARRAIETNDIDLAFFAEFKQTNLSEIVNALGDNYFLYDGYGGCDKICLIARNNFIVGIVREATRYTIYHIQFQDTNLLIGSTHLPDPRNSDKEDRKKVIRDLVDDILTAEQDCRCDRTLVIGDFNASPFDEELVQKDCFNAVLFKDLIINQEYVESNESEYRRFYNPAIDYMSEEHKRYGSFYRSSGIKSLYWYSYDQVIMRKALIGSFIRMDYLKKIADQDLITKHAIAKSISDHLPLYVELKGRV